MIHNEGYFKGKNGLKLYYQTWSPDENPKAIIQIVHGLVEHSGRYLNVVNELVPKGYIIYASDQRGHGKSEGIKAFVKNFEYFVDDQKTFFELIKEKEPDLPIFLLGHSMGASVSILFASKYQEGLQGLILSGAGTKAGGGAGNIFARGLVKLMAKIRSKSKIDPRTTDLISRDPEVVKAYIEDPLVHKKSTFKLIGELLKSYDKTTNLLDRIKIPTLVQCGSDDKLVLGAEDLDKLMKMEDKTIKIYKGLYHEVYNELEEDRKTVLNDLTEWLDSHL